MSYTALVEITTRRTITVVAPSLTAARRAVRARFGARPGKITHICADATTAELVATGRAALRVLLTAEFLDIDGAPATIGDWVQAIQATRAAQPQSDLNSRMAPAGLRVLPGGIAVANSPAILFLTDLFAATNWAGGRWNHAMALIPGASRANLTFAGIRSRAVIVPLPANQTKRSNPNDTGPNRDTTGQQAQNVDNRPGGFRTTRRVDCVFSSKRAAADGLRRLSPAIAAQPQPGDVAARAGAGLD